MQIFISWSGTQSGTVAEALRSWLPRVIQATDPWLSSADVEAGARWHQELGSVLESCQFGIICLTPENRESPWVLYEAGGLSKSVEQSRVVPYLIGMRKADIEGPLAPFQSVEADHDGTWDLVKAMNNSLAAAGDRVLSDDALTDAFEVWWPKLEEAIAAAVALPAEGTVSSPRDTNEMIVEIVDSTRTLSRRFEEFLERTRSAQASTHDGRAKPEKELVLYAREILGKMLPDLESEAHTSGMLKSIDGWRSIVKNDASTFDELNEALRGAKSLRRYLDR